MMESDAFCKPLARRQRVGDEASEMFLTDASLFIWCHVIFGALYSIVTEGGDPDPAAF